MAQVLFPLRTCPRLSLHHNWVCNGCQHCLAPGQSSSPDSTQGIPTDALTRLINSGRGSIDMFKLMGPFPKSNLNVGIMVKWD